MGKIAVKNITPGMVLSGDVKDSQGRLLAPAGQEVSRKLIRIFKIWGIGEIPVRPDAEDDPGKAEERAIPKEIREKADEITRYRFQYNDLNDPFIYELFRASYLEKARKINKNRDAQDISLPEPDEADAPQDGRRRKNRKLDAADLIHKTIRLGTIPDIYYKTIAAINNPDASLDDIAGIVSKDMTLSAKVLQLVNSSFYSLRQKVDTLTWALALIGTNQLMTIVSGVSAVSFFKKIPSRFINMVSFWEHSIACGTAARLLSSYFPGRIEQERFFVAGLLHDIGRLIMVQNLSGEYYELFRDARSEEIFLFAAEAQRFGLDHSEIGAQLASLWNLPESLCQMIRCHHFPGHAGVFHENAIINLADIIVNALETGNSGEFFVPVIEPGITRELGLDRHIILPVVSEIDYQLADIFEIIYGTVE